MSIVTTSLSQPVNLGGGGGGGGGGKREKKKRQYKIFK